MFKGYSNGQRQKATRIIEAALAAGYTVDIDDDEGTFDLERCSDRDEILSNIGEMEVDDLVFREAGGLRVGWMRLVWGNADDGSELVSDYTNNSEMEALDNA